MREVIKIMTESPVIIERRSTPSKINLNLSTGFTLIGLIVAGLVAYYSARIADATNIAEINGRINVANTRVDSLEKSIDALGQQVESGNNKIDALLINQGIDPKRIN